MEVRAEVNLEITMENIRFGVVTKSWGIWDWFVGAKGKARWKVGREAPPGCKLGPGEFVTEKEVKWETLKVVDVVLWEGKAPEPNHYFWGDKRVKVMMWMNVRRAIPEEVANNWVIRSYFLSHARLGGVTTARVRVYIAIRTGCGWSWQYPESRFRNWLGQVIDPVHGGPYVEPVEERKVNRVRDTYSSFTTVEPVLGREIFTDMAGRAPHSSS